MTQTQQTRPAQSQPAQSQPPTILVADDEQDIREPCRGSMAPVQG
ncbi:MAG: hypothetical protein ACR2MP_32330 [Streptosporangiaceae bacterium]